MIRDPNGALNELRTAVQGPQENAHKFCCRCVAMKKKVQCMYEEEGVAYDEENLSAIFFRAISTGLRQSNIRNELRQMLRDADISDHDLLYEVSLAVANEEERMKKMVENGKKVNVNMLTFESDSDEPGNEASFSDSSLKSSGCGIVSFTKITCEGFVPQEIEGSSSLAFIVTILSKDASSSEYKSLHSLTASSQSLSLGA